MWAEWAVAIDDEPSVGAVTQDNCYQLLPGGNGDKYLRSLFLPSGVVGWLSRAAGTGSQRQRGSEETFHREQTPGA